MEGIEIVAQLMAIAAKTAPKTKGEDFVRTKILIGDELGSLADAMLAFGEKTRKKNFDRDGWNVSKSDAVVLIGVKDALTVGLDCGACGFPDCSTFQTADPFRGRIQGPNLRFPPVGYGDCPGIGS